MSDFTLMQHSAPYEESFAFHRPECAENPHF